MSVQRATASVTESIAMFVGVLPANASAQAVAGPPAGASSGDSAGDWPWGRTPLPAMGSRENLVADGAIRNVVGELRGLHLL